MGVLAHDPNPIPVPFSYANPLAIPLDHPINDPNPERYAYTVWVSYPDPNPLGYADAVSDPVTYSHPVTDSHAFSRQYRHPAQCRGDSIGLRGILDTGSGRAALVYFHRHG